MEKHTTRTLKKAKGSKSLSMLTCYDYQTAQMLEETSLDLILVGDSVGNVILGFDTTVPVTIEHMCLFGAAVKKGAPSKFTIVDLPFGTYATPSLAIKNAIQLFQHTGAEALKLEGASQSQIESIKLLTDNGILVMGNIGLTPQFVHQLGGYYTHGKNSESAKLLMQMALELQQAGVFSIVLECVEKELAKKITQELRIPTIGIGSGAQTDGQVLVINDLLKNGRDTPPKFCTPMANYYDDKKRIVENYIRGI